MRLKFWDKDQLHVHVVPIVRMERTGRSTGSRKTGNGVKIAHYTRDFHSEAAVRKCDEAFTSPREVEMKPVVDRDKTPIKMVR